MDGHLALRPTKFSMLDSKETITYEEYREAKETLLALDSASHLPSDSTMAFDALMSEYDEAARTVLAYENQSKLVDQLAQEAQEKGIW